MKKRIAWLILSCLMVAVLLLPSCGPAEEEEVLTPPEEEVAPPEEEAVVPEEKEMVEDSLGRLVEKPKYGGVLTLVTGDPTGFDEAFTASGLAFTLRYTNEELLTGDWTMGPAGTGECTWLVSQCFPEYETGSVAESWEIVDDQTIRLKIRKGIHFALNPQSEASQLVGGREMNAHDAVYSLRRHFLTPGCYMHTTRTDEQREGWDAWAENDWTVIHQYPLGFRLSGLLEYSDFCAIIAKEVIDKYGDMRDWRNAVGTGPFMLVDYVSGSSLTFVRNTNYWQKHPIYPEDTMPYLDGIKMLIIPDLSTRLSALRTGKLDYLSVSWEDARDLVRTNPELKHMKYLSTASGVITMVMDNPDLPWYDKRVRYALALAIDNQKILSELYANEGELCGYPILPVSEFRHLYTPLEEQLETVRELFGYNPEKAKQLLAEAGYPGGFKAKIVCTSGWVDALSVVKDYWEKIGVDLQIDVKDSPVVTSILVRKKVEEMTIQSATGFGVDNVIRFDHYFGIGWQNMRRVDDTVCNQAAKALDELGWEYLNPAKVAAIMKPVYQYVLEQCWDIPLPAYYTYKFWQPWVKDFRGEGSVGFYNASNWLHYIWLDQELKEEMTGIR